MRFKPNAAQASSMAKPTADKFEEQYDATAAEADATAAKAETAIRISNGAELETKYGDILAPMADANPSALRLCGTLKKLTPPVLVTDGVAKEWF